jgi:hypothetical protein
LASQKPVPNDNQDAIAIPLKDISTMQAGAHVPAKPNPLIDERKQQWQNN